MSEKEIVNEFVAACKDGEIEIVERMMKENERLVLVNRKDKAGMTGLMMAMQYNHSTLVKHLLSSQLIKLDISASRSRNTALHIGCSNNSFESVKKFLQHPQCKPKLIRMWNVYRKTAEMVADEKGHSECARLVRNHPVSTSSVESLTIEQLHEALNQTVEAEEKIKKLKEHLEERREKAIKCYDDKLAEMLKRHEKGKEEMLKRFQTEKENQDELLEDNNKRRNELEDELKERKAVI